MTLTLVKPEQVVSSAYARWLIYGDNGVGKSTFARTMPRPMMVITADGENLAPYSGLDGVIINVINDWDQIQETFRLLNGKQGESIKSVVFETLTRLMGFYLDKLTGVKRTGIEVGAYLAQRPSMKATNFQTWSDLGFMSTQTVFDFNHLPKHLVYLCQETTLRPQFEQDILETIPVLSPASWKGVKDIVHLVGRLYVTEAAGGTVTVTTDGNRSINPNRKDQRMLLIGKHDRYFTKGDTETLGYAVPNPTWDNLSKALKA